jgi:hypothetical protein
MMAAGGFNLMMAAGGFNLRKWNSNPREIIKRIEQVESKGDNNPKSN